MSDPFEDYGIPRHPDADKFRSGSWEEPGQCICGVPLPPQKDWNGAGRDWASVVCGSCGRGYVDEEEFIAIYDEGLDDEGDPIGATVNPSDSTEQGQ